MPEVLSQKEIDELLHRITVDGDSVEEEVSNSKKNIRIYDFKRPNKFSKDHIISIRNIHENLTRGLTTFFSGHLHSIVDTKVIAIDQITYSEFIRSLPNPTVLGIYSFQPLEGSILMEMNSMLVFSIINRLLGGQDGKQEKNRDLTEIERAIIMHRLEDIGKLISESWGEVFPIDAQYISLETNPQFTQIISPNEMVLLITIEIIVGETTGMMNICLPYLVLEPILDKLNSYFLFSSHSKEVSAEQQTAMKHKIEFAKVEMRTILGEAEISVKELMDLNEGDIIVLSQKVSDPLQIYIEDFLKFEGVPGQTGDSLAVQITDILEDENQ